MAQITIEPATLPRFDDVQHAFSGGGDGGSCQCQWFMMRNREWEATDRNERTEMLRADMSDDLAPGLVAYVDGESAGWVKIAPRTRQPRLAFTKALAASPEPWDADDVWAVTCFVVRREHRGAGLNTRLLASAVDFARANGARVIEAYPIDTSVAQKRVNELFVGVLSTFLAAGFREVARAHPARPIMSLDLSTP